MAAFFGPIMVAWFLTLAALGFLHLADDPHIFAEINPLYGIKFLIAHPMIGLVTLGLVFLAVTGGEALYADLGHFGRRPIQTAWFLLVFPALVINYFGQGAMVLADPSALENPFYRMAPEPLLIPMVVLATAATVIASQAVITGAYSITPAGDPARPHPAARHPSHVGNAVGADLYSAREHRAARRRVVARRLVQDIEPSRLHLRDCGHDDQGGRRIARFRRYLEAVAVGAVGRCRAGGAVCPGRFDLLHGQSAQAAGRGVGAAIVRRRHRADDRHLAAGHAAAERHGTKPLAR